MRGRADQEKAAWLQDTGRAGGTQVPSVRDGGGRELGGGWLKMTAADRFWRHWDEAHLEFTRLENNLTLSQTQSYLWPSMFAPASVPRLLRKKGSLFNSAALLERDYFPLVEHTQPVFTACFALSLCIFVYVHIYLLRDVIHHLGSLLWISSIMSLQMPLFTWPSKAYRQALDVAIAWQVC